MILLSLLYPMRWCVTHLSRWNPLRIGSGMILRRMIARVPYQATMTTIVPLDAPDLRLSCSDSMVEDSVFWFGVRGYEGVLYDLWLLLARQSESILEIGGNVGFYSLAGARANPQARYRVLEPHPHVGSVLRRNLDINGLIHVELIHAAAIPDRTPHRVYLNVPDEGRSVPVGSHLVDDVKGINRSTKETIACNGVPILDLLAGVDLVKIDAEGIEYALIAASFDVLVIQRPVLVVEVLPEATQLTDVLRALAEAAGYRIYVVPGWGSDQLVEVSARKFEPTLLPSLNSKDVILTTKALAWKSRLYN